MNFSVSKKFKYNVYIKIKQKTNNITKSKATSTVRAATACTTKTTPTNSTTKQL